MQKLKIHEQTLQYINAARLLATLYCVVILEKSSFSLTRAASYRIRKQDACRTLSYATGAESN